ncbi:MAG: 1,4-alpha-glucan branching protein GlgB [Gemmataceae bacterium]
MPSTDTKLTRRPSAPESVAAPPRREQPADASDPRCIPGLDLYLFNMGEQRHAHRFLGAHLVDGGVRFAVWAPNAARVAVVGSFNGWNPDAHPLTQRGTTGVWEGIVPGLQHGFTYKFALDRPGRGWDYRVDPFARMLENNLNRTPIFAETYFEFKHPRLPMADKLGGALNIFEVHPLSWRFKDGRPLSYLELIDELVPYVKYMEYTHVELMGILEHPYVPSWGYQVIGFYAPTSRLGTPTDFKQLVDAFHAAGIGVILDAVLVHFPTDHTGLALYDNDCNLFECPIPDRKHTPWGTYYFDFARNEVKSFLISSLFHWVEEFFIDGFRFDAAGQFHHYEFATEDKYRTFLTTHGNCHNPEGFQFMQAMCKAMRDESPETLLIAEDSTIAAGVTHPVETGGHGFDFKWDLGCTSHMMKFFRAPYARRSDVYNDLTYPMLYHHTENFLLPLCHDEVVHMKRSMVNKTEDLSDFDKFANLRLLYLLQFGYPQKKLLFMGQEFGQKSEWNAEEPLPWASTWDHLHKTMQWYVKRLNEVYRFVPAMHQGDNIPNGFEWIECNNPRHLIVAFLRYDQGYNDLLVYLINLSKNHFPEFRLGVPFAGTYHKVIDTDAQEFGGNGHHGLKDLASEPVAAFHHAHSIRTPLLPLHGMLLRLVGRPE